MTTPDPDSVEFLRARAKAVMSHTACLLEQTRSAVQAAHDLRLGQRARFEDMIDRVSDIESLVINDDEVKPT
ncbi:hypothetical protein [Tateyamaria sp. SN3-11]|uniref:hypothetical protein n=1 Tax=Tateyamaria sp. SN3-11 TaxID=3092147 RepID=UPI0039ECF41D